MRTLITGATGFAGKHLSQLSLSSGDDVFGFAESGTFVEGVKECRGDITSPGDVEAALAASNPDYIFHLAAIVHGIEAQQHELLYRVNICGTYNLLDAVTRMASLSRVLVASSSSIYGQPIDATLPITEQTPLSPKTAYALSKTAQDLMARQFFLEHGITAISGRVFNQIGPGEPDTLVCSSLARQVALIEAGLQESVLSVTSLEVRRDFCDVRDVAAGYRAALQYGKAGTAYNICSGRSQSVRQIAELLLSLTDLSGVKLKESGAAAEGVAVLEQTGSSARLKACSGWSPHIPLTQSLALLLNEWRHKVRSAA